MRGVINHEIHRNHAISQPGLHRSRFWPGTRLWGNGGESGGFLLTSFEQRVRQTHEVHIVGTVDQSLSNGLEPG
jgi:hypothetical protein